MEQDLKTQVREALQTVKFPGLSRDIVSFGFVQGVEIDAGAVTVNMSVTSHNPKAVEQVRDEVEKVVSGIDGVTSVRVELKISVPQSPVQQAIAQDPNLLPGVEHVVAVASGKGGVGKSTVAANLVVRLAQKGLRVGLLDADIYGPSVPLLFGITDRPMVTPEGRLLPFEKYGVKIMSLGFVLDTDTPVIWRGPMVMKALEQLLGDVQWGELDVMVVDLPPGTGDAQLTLTQKVPLTGAVVVTTPQDLALADARKGLAMFRKVNVPVVGIIENMSTFVCPHCGETTDIFKHGGGKRTAEELDCVFLGDIPLDPAIMLGGDSGEPIVMQQPEGPHAEAFGVVADAVMAEMEKKKASGERLSIV